jgi:hypothetical protein
MLARDAPQAASSEPYLSQLTNQGLDALRAEPTALASTSAQLTNALTTLCHAAYPTFLALHRSSGSLGDTLSSLSTSLTSLLDTLPTLQTSAGAFSASAEPLLAERRETLAVRERAGTLADVLELPRLIDASARAGALGDALDLAAHAASLAKAFPEVPLVADVAAEAAAAERALLAQLLGALAEPGRGRLPALFRAIGFLRRMHALPEPVLALAFLAGRLAALTATLDALERERIAAAADGTKDADARFLRKYVESWREGVHDGVAQFGTIFLERSTALGGAPAPAAASSSGTAESPPLHALLARFCNVLVARLLRTLEARLPGARAHDPATVRDLLSQLGYCAAACARSGIDFRPLLGPPFNTAVRDGMRAEFAAATSAFAARVAACQKRRSPPSRWLIVPSAAADPPAPDEDAGNKPAHAVPQGLATYPPLAELANAVLTSLNGLRLLAPRAILPALLTALDDALADAARSLLEYALTDADARPEEEARVVRAAGAMLARAFVPFARRALVEGVYGVVIDRRTGPLLTKASGLAARALKDVMSEWEEWLDDDEDGSEGKVDETEE